MHRSSHPARETYIIVALPPDTVSSPSPASPPPLSKRRGAVKCFVGDDELLYNNKMCRVPTLSYINID